MSWQTMAACRGLDPELFFPTRGESTAAARAVCAACVVRVECAETAIAGERFGVWGGLSERQRRRVRQGRCSAAGPVGMTVSEVAS